MQQAKNTVGWLAFITCIVMGVYLLLPAKEKDDGDQEITQLALQHFNDSILVESYRALYLEGKEVNMRLQVEKGQIEIEKNRYEAQLKNSSTGYKEKKQLKDTASAIVICDSIVYTYLPQYFETENGLSNINDSILLSNDDYFKKLYEAGDSIAFRLDTVGKQSIEEKKENIKLKAENKTQKRRVLRAGFFGAAIGIILTLLSGLL